MLQILRAHGKIFRLKHRHTALPVQPQGTLDRKGKIGYRKGIIAAASAQRIQPALQVGRAHERGGGIQAADFGQGWLEAARTIRLPALAVQQPAALTCRQPFRQQRGNGMTHHGAGSGEIIRQLGRAHKRGFHAVLPRHGGDFFIIGRHRHTRKAAALQRRFDGIGNHRLTVE